jgi:hypothetical protein
MKCDVCGSSYVIADGRSYACSGYLDGRICSNKIRVRRQVVEDRLLAAIKRDMLTDGAIAEFKRRLRRALDRRIRMSSAAGSSRRKSATSPMRSQEDCCPLPLPSACETQKQVSPRCRLHRSGASPMRYA